MPGFFERVFSGVGKTVKYAFVVSARQELERLGETRLPAETVRDIAKLRDVCNAILLSQPK